MTRRLRSESVQLITRAEMKSPFGTITSAPSKVRTLLARMPIVVTMPKRSSSWTRSPTRIGRSKSRITPETKLLTTFWSPKPMPTPNALSIRVTRSREKPIAPMATTKPTTRIA